MRAAAERADRRPGCRRITVTRTDAVRAATTLARDGAAAARPPVVGCQAAELMARRLLALLGALAMVAGALAVRHRIDARGAATAAAAGRRITCTPELSTACDALAASGATVTVEAAGATAARLAALPPGADAGLDSWVATAPWPQLVDSARRRKGATPLFGAARPLGRSPLVVAIWPDRAAVLQAGCPAGLTWRCLGDGAKAASWAMLRGNPAWGRIKTGLADPVTADTGLDVLGAATAGWVGTPSVSAQDLDDETFRARLAGLATTTPRGASLEQMLAGGPAVLDLFATTDAAAASALRSYARTPRPLVLTPSPPASAIAVLTTRADPTAARREEDPADAAAGLGGAGWDVTAKSYAAPVPDQTTPGPATGGLPSAGTLDALRSAWTEARR